MFLGSHFFLFFLPPPILLPGVFIMKRIYGKRAREIRFQWSPLFLFLFSNWKFLLFCFGGEMFSHEQKTRINTTHSLVFIFFVFYFFIFPLFYKTKKHKIKSRFFYNSGSIFSPNLENENSKFFRTSWGELMKNIWCIWLGKS
jgi:hypothetical protein